MLYLNLGNLREQNHSLGNQPKEQVILWQQQLSLPGLKMKNRGRSQKSSRLNLKTMKNEEVELQQQLPILPKSLKNHKGAKVQRMTSHLLHH